MTRDDAIVYENTFELSPHSSQLVDEPVFGSENAEYHVEATHDDITRQETIDGLPCEERRGRFVSVVLGRNHAFKISVRGDDDYPS